MSKIIIDPVTRIEGHLRIDTEVEDGSIREAWSKGEMFRGFEAILNGRDAFDAPVITQRICGVCPISHAIAASKAVEDAIGMEIPENARLMRNLVLGANFLASHLTHFYQLSALDYIQIESILDYRGDNATLTMLKSWVKQELASNKILPGAPFLPHISGDFPKDQQWNYRAVSHYIESLGVRKDAHKMAALLGGKMPHSASIIAGGVTTALSPDLIEDFRSRLFHVRSFIDQTYLPDVVKVAGLFPQYAGIGKGRSSFLAYGVFDEGEGQFLPGGVLKGRGLSPLDTQLISEVTTKSYYADSEPLHPEHGVTNPEPGKTGAYSWLKAPRYNSSPFEVGPLSRILIADKIGIADVSTPLNSLLKQLKWTKANLNSVMGRHAARALEASLVAQRMESWLDALSLGESSVGAYPLSISGVGAGLVEAPRGALGHWVTLENKLISSYQCIVPSTWNFSPKDGQGKRGPVEEALINTPVAPKSQGLEAARVVRSFDPCIACAIH